MATPDYLQQVIVSGRKARQRTVEFDTSRRVFQRPSVTSLVWASLDALTSAVAAVMAVQAEDQCGPTTACLFSMLPDDSYSNAPTYLDAVPGDGSRWRWC